MASATASPNSGAPGLTTQLDASNSSSGASYQAIVIYSWDFGDGSTGTGVTVSHTYNSTGAFFVVLTVTNSAGLTDTTSLTITITGSSTGGGSGGGTVSGTATVVHAAFRLNNRTTGRDSFTATLSAPNAIGARIPHASTTAGTLTVGTVSIPFSYDPAHGRGYSQSVRISVNDRNGAIQISVRNANFQSLFNGSAATIPLSIDFGSGSNLAITATLQVSPAPVHRSRVAQAPRRIKSSG